MADYEGTPTIVYGFWDNEFAIYYKVCPKCGRFVKADDTTRLPEHQGNEPNATCKKCGRVQMPFCTWSSDVEVEHE